MVRAFADLRAEHRSEAPSLLPRCFGAAGNEGSLDTYVHAAGLMWESAPRFRAMLLFAEVCGLSKDTLVWLLWYSLDSLVLCTGHMPSNSCPVVAKVGVPALPWAVAQVLREEPAIWRGQLEERPLISYS